MSNSHRLAYNVPFITLILAAALLAGTYHAAVHGTPAPTVCLSISANSCPSSPPTFTRQRGSSLTVFVVAQNVGSIQTFIVSVQTNASVLYPVSASVINSVVSQGMPVGTTQCINGGGGSEYCGTQDGPGVVSVKGWGYYPSPSPTNGMLFSITYNVTGSGANIPIFFPSDCPGGLCVSLGSTVSVQNAAFSNILPARGDFTISSNSTSLTTGRGMMGAINISLAGNSGFFGTIFLNVTISSFAISGWFSSPVVTLQVDGTASSDLEMLPLASVAPGAYNVTVVGTAGKISHSLILKLVIISQEGINAIENGDFGSGLAYWTTAATYPVSFGLPYPTNYPIIQTTNATGSCTPSVLQGSQFLDIWNTLGSAGYAEQSFTVPRVGGAELAFLSWGWITRGSESATVSIVANGGETVLDTFVPPPSLNSTSQCTRTVPEMKVYDISGFAGQTVDLRFSAEAYTCCRADSLFTDAIVVPKGSAGLRDFSIAASPGSLTVPDTTNGTFTVTLGSLNGFDTMVQLSATVTPSSPMWPYQIPIVVFSQNPVQVDSGKSVNISAIFVATKTTPATSYSIALIGTSSRMQATATVTVSVPSVALLYEVYGSTAVQAGGSEVFVNHLTNVGARPARIILVTVTTDFGAFTLLDDSQCPGNTPTMQLGNSGCDLPNAPLIPAGDNSTLTLNFMIPRSVNAGVHVLTETVEWQYLYPYVIVWENGNNIVAEVQVVISASPSPGPQPINWPSPQAVSTLASRMISMIESYGPILLTATLAILAAGLLLARRAQKPGTDSSRVSRHTLPLGSNSIPCTHCGSQFPVTGLFCPNCGVRRTS